MSLKIEDYALLGDCETAALVGRDGSIDWLCWPRFDSGACFAALLGGREHGRWLITTTDKAVRVSRRYRDDTLILETDFETADGAVTLVDFMPPRGKTSDVIRMVVGRRGRVAMRTEFILRFDYGSLVPWVTRMEDGGLLAVSGPDMVVLRTPVRLRGKDFTTIGDFTVSAGQTIPFVLTYSASHLSPPAPIDAQKALVDTEKFWRRWTSRCTSAGKWSADVRRSLITLKALTYRPTGGIVAAPTTSLPEQLGGPRNWDYRFCWLRDATFTLLALMNSGYYEEARSWQAWLLRAVAGQPSQVQIMYGLLGERRLTEWEIPWLPGYEGSKPVRIGNAAATQLQLDIFGEVMDAFHQGRNGKLAVDEHAWAVQRALLDHLETIWDQPDEGIWEIRSGRQQYTYSKMMTWVAFDRAIKGAEEFGLEGPVERWRALRGKSTKRSVVTHSTRRLALLCNRTDQRTSMPVCCSFQPLASYRPMIQGFEARLPLSSNIYWRTVLSDAMTPRTPATACPGRRRIPRLQLLARRWPAGNRAARGSTAVIRTAACTEE